MTWKLDKPTQEHMQDPTDPASENKTYGPTENHHICLVIYSLPLIQTRSQGEDHIITSAMAEQDFSGKEWRSSEQQTQDSVELRFDAMLKSDEHLN